LCYNICMNKPLKLIKIGNSTGVILPKDVLAHLNLAQGDEVSVVKQADGIALKSADPDFDQQMATARDVMGRYRNALRELAK
jgi:putative addiction module antidote